MSSPDSNSPDASRGALILVVERNPVVQRLERYFLEQAGFSVEFTTDGLTALARSLARCRELHPRIVVSEILVPKLDGLSLCRTLKTDPITQDILVMIFSHLQADDRAAEAGADAFLSKPLDEELLLATVEGLLDSRRQAVGDNS
jgi:CheY-like chemotaxis protein